MTVRYFPSTRARDPIAEQTTGTYEDYKKIKGFEDVGYFLVAYVASGGEVTKNITRNDQIDVSDIVVSLNDDIMARDGVSFPATIANATYYLDFTMNGDFSWSTSHPSGSAGTDYLTIATVTTDENKNIDVITDTRGTVGGFRLKSDYGLSDYAKVADLDALKAETVTGIYNAKGHGLSGDGSTNDYTALSDLLTLIGSDNATIVCSPGTYKLSSNITIPANVTMWMFPGSMLSPDTGVTITLDGEIKDTIEQIFTGLGSVVRSDVNYKIVEVRPEWWGGVPDGSTDCTSPIQNVVSFIGTSKIGTMLLSKGVYKIASTTIDVDCSLSIIGAGKLETTIMGYSYASDVSMFNYQGTSELRIDGIVLKNFTIRGNDTNPRGFNMDWVVKSKFDNIRFYNVKRGMVMDTCWSNLYQSVTSFGVVTSVIHLTTQCNNSVFINCSFVAASGLLIDGSMAQIGLYGCDFEQCTTYGVGIVPTAGNAVQNVNVSNCYFENNTGTAVYTGVGTIEGLNIDNCYFTVESSTVDYTILVRNLTGFTIKNNVAQNFNLYFVNQDNTAVNGEVTNNKYTAAALTNTGQTFSSPSVRYENNSTGRRHEFRSTIPTIGSYTIGDFVEKIGAPGESGTAGSKYVVRGWMRLTTGSNHVLNTDWLESRTLTGN